MRLKLSKSRHFKVSFGVKICMKISPELMMEASKVWRMRANLPRDVSDPLPLLKISSLKFWSLLKTYLIKSHIIRKLMTLARAAAAS